VKIEKSPMSTFALIFDGKVFPVPKKSLFELFEQHHELFSATSYAVQSSARLDVFEAFVGSLKTQSKLPVTRGNAVSLSSLAKEFFLSELAADCAAFSVPLDEFSALSDRVSELERRISFCANRPGPTDDVIEAHEEELESLRLALAKLQTFVEGDRNQLKSPLGALSSQSKPLPPIPDSLWPTQPRPEPEQSMSTVEIPAKVAKSLDGIISYLTTKYGGNVHDRGIVTVLSRSSHDDPKLAVRNVADLTSDSRFYSKDEPGQWVCWDFRQMRVRLAQYTIRAQCLKSWVLEGSLDGANWMEIDGQWDNDDFQAGWSVGTASFAAWSGAEFRFIRLTQTDKNYYGTDCHTLPLTAVEFFGTLSE
jgi:hypothetical protein